MTQIFTVCNSDCRRHLNKVIYNSATYSNQNILIHLEPLKWYNFLLIAAFLGVFCSQKLEKNCYPLLSPPTILPLGHRNICEICGWKREGCAGRYDMNHIQEPVSDTTLIFQVKTSN